MNETESNPLIRFLNEHNGDLIKNIRESAEDNAKQIASLKKTLLDAQIRISEMLREL